MNARIGTTLIVLIYDKWKNRKTKHGRNEVFTMRRHHPKIKIPWKHWGVLY